MSAQLEQIENLAGEYTGAGARIDTTGSSDHYAVRHTITTAEDTAEMSLVQRFNDGSSVEAHLRFERSSPPIFDVYVGDELVGHGYFEAGTLHYQMRAGEAHQEVSCRRIGDDLRLYGSSAKNGVGNYIVWLERLHRVDTSASPR